MEVNFVSDSEIKFSLIGSGKVGTALAYLLAKENFTLITVIDKSISALEQAQGFLRGDICFTHDLFKLTSDLDFIILGVSDDQIKEVVRSLEQQNLLHSGQTLIHLSGAHPSDHGNLREIPEVGRLSMHPLQSVADVEAGIISLQDSVWSIEGNEQGLKLGEEILTKLQVKWMKINQEQKPIYHAAACLVSNYLVTLTQLGVEMLQKLGFPTDLAQSAIIPLIQGTVDNLKTNALNAGAPKHVLTGPIARGDIATVRKHVKAIAEIDNDLEKIYLTLGDATTQFASLDKDTYQSLHKLFLGVGKDGS